MINLVKLHLELRDLVFAQPKLLEPDQRIDILYLLSPINTFSLTG